MMINFVKMYRYTKSETKNGAEPVFCDVSPFSDADWREFEALGMVEISSAGDNELMAHITPKGIALAHDLIWRAASLAVGFLLGLLTGWLT